MKKFLLFCLFLTGCGFTPLYKTSTVDNSIQIDVQPIPEQYGFQMRQILKKTLPERDDTLKVQYILNVLPPEFSSGSQTITTDEFASMMQVNAHTRYQLKDIKNQILLSNTVDTTGSYIIGKNPYATTVAENKIFQTLSEEMAQQIAIDVLTFLDGNNS